LLAKMVKIMGGWWMPREVKARKDVA